MIGGCEAQNHNDVMPFIGCYPFEGPLHHLTRSFQDLGKPRGCEQKRAGNIVRLVAPTGGGQDGTNFQLRIDIRG